MLEVWKNIEGFNGFYQISNMGRVRNYRGRLRALSYTHDGYVRIRLLHGGKDITCRVHRLVAKAFIPNPQNKETVNHIDGDKNNNKVTNLEWVDRSEQMNHAYQLGLKQSRSGDKNANAKLTADQVREIRATYVWQSKEFGTVALAKKYGVTNRIIGLIVRGLAYKNIK